ncbi:MAG: hypothetical protein CMH52_02270 [Myxococcales bacterium]|nr:hypothetical protein [Myxococcales bacterium]
MGCSSSSSFRSCSSESDYQFVKTATNVIEDSVQGVITSRGFDFIYENRETLVGLLFNIDSNGWASIPISDFGRDGDSISVAARDLNLGVELRRAGLGIELLPNPFAIRVDIQNARLRFDSGIASIMGLFNGACQLGNGVDRGTVNESFALANLTVTLYPSIDSDGLLTTEVNVDNLVLSDINLDFIFDQTLPECRTANCATLCSTGELGAAVTEILYRAFSEEIGSLITPVVEIIVNETLSELNDTPLLFEGQFLPSILSAILPLPRDANKIGVLLEPGSSALEYISGENENSGIGLRLNIGSESADHPCVPGQVGEPRFLSGPAPDLSGSDPNGNPAHFGMSVANGTLNRLIWSFWRAGYLCLRLNSDQIETSLGSRIDSDTLSIFLPSLSTLAKKATPIMVVLDPRFDQSDFPLTKLKNVETAASMPQAGIELKLPRLGIDMYVYLNERWTRMTQVITDAEIDLVIQAGQNNELILTGEAPRIGEIRVTYNELLESDDVDALLRAMLDVAIGSFLNDGLDVDFSLTGLVSEITGLPYDLNISTISSTGTDGDHLGIYMNLMPESGSNALRKQIETWAEIKQINGSNARVKVGSKGIRNPAYQYRFNGGLWRPMRNADAGYINVSEPRFGLKTNQTLEVRAVDKDDPKRFDNRPVSLVYHPDLYDHLTDENSASAQGCNSNPNQNSSDVFICLGILFLCRRRFRSRLGAAIVLMVVCGACQGPSKAPDLPCSTDAECPNGLACLDNFCRPQRPCQSDDQCCAIQICQQGKCRSAPTDDCQNSGCLPHQVCFNDYCVARECEQDSECNGVKCVRNLCVENTPCGARCGPDETCIPHRNVCRILQGNCAQTCPNGSVRIALDSIQLSQAVCDLDAVICECITSFGQDVGAIAREADMAIVDGKPIFAVFDSFYEDLVLITEFGTVSESHYYMDGFPSMMDHPLPSLTRHGERMPGPVRGLYPQIESDSAGRLHFAYYDADAKHLRYMRRDGQDRWTGPIVVDSSGDVGRYVKLKIDQLDRPHLIYSVLNDSNGYDGLRYALGSNTAENQSHFEVVTIASEPSRGPVEPMRAVPTRFGQRPCMTLDGDQVVTAFISGHEKWIYFARGGVQGFRVKRLQGQLDDTTIVDQDERYMDFNNHEIGEHCSIDSQNGDINLVFTNERTWALMSYHGSIDGQGLIQVVDSGPREQRSIIGASPDLKTDQNNRLVAIYQDSTRNDLLLNIRRNGQWLPDPIVIESDGAVGYSNSLEIMNNDAFIGTVKVVTDASGRDLSEVLFYPVNLSGY